MSFTIKRAHVRELLLVKPLWKAIIQRYQEVAGDELPVRSPDEAWQRRHQEYLNWINDGAGVVYLAVDDDTTEVIGYASLFFSTSGSAYDTGDRLGELETLAVAAGHRDKGVGTGLIDACRTELRKRDIHYWSLDTLVGNRRAMKLYERAGFVPLIVRMIQHIDDDGVNPKMLEGTETTAMPVVVGGGGTSTRVSAASAESDIVRTTPDLPWEREVDPVIVEKVQELARGSRTAARALAVLSRAQKDAALSAMADALLAGTDRILAANAEDIARGEAGGMAAGLLDRLRLDRDRLKAIAYAVRQVGALPDPVGEVVRGSTLANGLQLRQVRVPFGVIGIIYEARPNVTADAAALCFKSGNAVILRGGSAAASSNRVLVEVLREALTGIGLPADAIVLLDEGGRDAARALMRARGLVDVIIPRGGADLIATVVRESTVPVIETGSGVCHVYIDDTADLAKATAITVNAKTQRPSVCNAAESLLVHRSVAGTHLPPILTALSQAGVVLHVDAETADIATRIGVTTLPATEEDYGTEWHSLEMSVAVVGDIDEAMERIRRYSTGHTEAIITENRANARRWVAEVDSAAVMVNASTRFTDGGEFGFGAEIGISTQKLHARGPMALPELTSTKWIVEGDGQIRV